jgi:gamma-glutamylcyclotransferase (GGCT)/AIG2-like uncharacterized protein YtfP
MKIHESKQLFVYSSLRKGFHKGPYHYIAQYFTFVSKGKVKGILSDSGSGPVGTPSDGDSFIIGELYQLQNEVEFSYVFGQLDEYEGLITEAGEDPLYRRDITTVYKEDGTVAEAWIYWYNHDTGGYPVIATGDVIQYMESKKQ